ncbi:VOC family protein [Staphylococcus chromogenes]|nr:VOC family protein [Staphylococcus chromogenes]
MTNSLHPYFGFAGNAAEAMTFYQEVFGGELQIMTFEQGGAGEFAANPQHVMHSQLIVNDSWNLMAADSEEAAGEGVGSPRITVAIAGSDDQLEAQTEQFNKLADGGNVVMPLEKQMWGAVYGQVVDKFGVTWQFNIGG